MLSVLLMTLHAAATPTFAVEPYLHLRPGDGVWVAWSWTAEGAEADPRVTFRDAGGVVDRVAAVQDGPLWRARLPLVCGFPAGFSYEVPGQAAPVAVDPLPCPDDEGTVRFGFVTDTQQDDAIAARAGKKLATLEQDFVIHGGDMVQWGGDDEQWPVLLGALAPATRSRPMLAAAGNHDFFLDSEGENIGRYFGVGPEQAGFYRFTSGPVLVIVLDSTHTSDEAFNARQLAFLKDSLARPARWKVVAFHHAVWSKGIAHFGWPWRERHEDIQAQYMPLFEEAGVDLVLNGHTHLFERSRKDDIEYVVGGAAGGMMGMFGGENPWSLRSEQRRTVIQVTATPDRLEVETFDLDEETEVDRLVIRAEASDERLATGSTGFRLPRFVTP